MICCCALRMRRRKRRYLVEISTNLCDEMIDSGSARRACESNDMCFEAGRCFVPEIASAHAHCDETHIIRFVSTSRTRIRQLRKDWLRSVRDIAVFHCACAVIAIAQLPMRRRKRRYLVENSTNLCADDRFWFSSSRRIE